MWEQNQKLKKYIKYLFIFAVLSINFFLSFAVSAATGPADLRNPWIETIQWVLFILFIVTVAGIIISLGLKIFYSKKIDKLSGGKNDDHYVHLEHRRKQMKRFFLISLCGLITTCILYGSTILWINKYYYDWVTT